MSITMTMTKANRTIDESIIIGQPSIAAGRLGDEDLDPERNVYHALKPFPIVPRHLSVAKYYRNWINTFGESGDQTKVTSEYLNSIKGNSRFFKTKGELFANTENESTSFSGS